MQVSDAAWRKMEDVLQRSGISAFVFSAQGGGCNGFNYHLQTVGGEQISSLIEKKTAISENGGATLAIDRKSEFLLIGTTIDYIKENYDEGIFESKFIFIPKEEFATACGCGVSFSPREL